MKKQTTFLLLVVFASSLACQLISPARAGTVISNCTDLTGAVAALQAGDIPDHLLETGVKQGDEFDANQYFNVLTNISMHEGYALDYVYQNDDLGGYPLLYPRPTDRAPYASITDVREDLRSSDFHDYLDVEDTEQGYFEYAVMEIMASQFYLNWHANYNDTEIVCSHDEINDIVTSVSTGDFGNPMSVVQQARARALRNVEPSVSLNSEVATVQFITFTKWGGFYRETYTIKRSFPHTILDVKQQNVVPYDCGVAF